MLHVHEIQTADSSSSMYYRASFTTKEEADIYLKQKVKRAFMSTTFTLTDAATGVVVDQQIGTYRHD